MYLAELFNLLMYAATVSKYDVTNNTVRVVEKNAKGDLSSPFPITLPSREIFDLLAGHV
jgi:hypothetical protein